MQLNQHTHIPYATTNQTKLGNWKQNKNDNATQKPGKHATNGITKTSKTPNWAKTRRTKPNRMAMETTLCNNDSLSATWTSMPSTFTTIQRHNDGTHWTALLSQVLLVRYNTVEASVLCNCIFLAQYPSLYFRFNCHGHWTKAHVSTRTHTHTPIDRTIESDRERERGGKVYQYIQWDCARQVSCFYCGFRVLLLHWTDFKRYIERQLNCSDSALTLRSILANRCDLLCSANLIDG